MKEIGKLDTGTHYWWRQKWEKIWRVCYIAEDPDENQWLYPIDMPPMKVSDLTLDCFDWQKIEEPSV